MIWTIARLVTSFERDGGRAFINLDQNVAVCVVKTLDALKIPQARFSLAATLVTRSAGGPGGNLEYFPAHG